MVELPIIIFDFPKAERMQSTLVPRLQKPWWSGGDTWNIMILYCVVLINLNNYRDSNRPLNKLLIFLAKLLIN